MRKTAVFTASFDPVTVSEIQAIRALMKKEHIHTGYLYVKSEGILERKRRMFLVSLAVKAYRHLSVCDELPEGIPVYTLAEDSEQEVRNGNFRAAARGIRRALNDHGDYYQEILDHLCKPSRAAHARSTAELCRKLAKAHGVNEKTAYFAGLLHDITKNADAGVQQKIMRIYYPELMHYHPNVWHSFTAVNKLRDDLCIHDRQFLNAVFTHTLGDGESNLSRILYIADKTEPTRSWDCSREVELAMKNLKAGRDLVYQEAQEYMEREKHV